jgi:hypothetical protein
MAHSPGWPQRHFGHAHREDWASGSANAYRRRAWYFAAILKADGNGLAAYQEMAESAEFQRPLSYAEVSAESFDGLNLPGGHASMRPYLESNLLRSIVSDFFAEGKPIGAIYHGRTFV